MRSRTRAPCGRTRQVVAASGRNVRRRGATPRAARRCRRGETPVPAPARPVSHAAAGGVGHLTVRIAEARGAHVIGPAGAAEHG
ncbi:NADP-dependent oxidoreductase, partial [Streptomyces sp. NPDC057254]